MNRSDFGGAEPPQYPYQNGQMVASGGVALRGPTPRNLSAPLRKWAEERARKKSTLAGIGCLSVVGILGVLLPGLALLLVDTVDDWVAWLAGGWLAFLLVGLALAFVAGKLLADGATKQVLALLTMGQIEQATVVDHVVELSDSEMPKRTFTLLIAGRTMQVVAEPGTFTASLPRGSALEVLYDAKTSTVIPIFDLPE